MPQFDLSLPELEQYAPDLTEPGDFDSFWSETLRETRSSALDATFEEVDNQLALVTSYDVTFAGFGGDRVKAWLHVPAGASAALPAVVEYAGYSGGRGLVHQGMTWALAGYASFVMDTRGQGWGFMVGSTPDPHVPAFSNATPGHMTSGILDPKEYFYRRVYADAVRAVEAAAAFELVDERRIVVAGGSQGGGMALAAASLSHGVLGALIDVPFLCHFERAVTLSDRDPYQEIARYLSRNRPHVEQAMHTLSYFDAAVLAPRASVPALFSVALMDPVCPPSTVYAAFNRYGGDKRIVTYPFNQHEGGQEFHQVEKYRWVSELLAP